MSRTRKGSKGPGYEVGRKREGKRGWRSAGAVAKRIGVRAQRRAGKAEAKPPCEACLGTGITRSGNWGHAVALCAACGGLG